MASRYDEDFDVRRPRRRGKRSQKSNRGLVIGLSVGGSCILVLIVVLAIGSSRGWFGKSNPSVAPGQQPPDEGKGIEQVLLPKPKPTPKPKVPNKELQRFYDRITLEQWSIETVEKNLGPGREVASADIDRLFDHVAFKQQIFEMFDKHRQELKVQRWLVWDREGDLLVLGLSRFRSGKVGISMMGMWSEVNKAFFNMSLRANPADIE